MPPLEPAPPLSRFEFWPGWIFYLPIWGLVIGLAIRHRGLRLPLLANPALPAGGLVGESKSEAFAALSGPERDVLAPYATLLRCGNAGVQVAVAEAAMAAAGIGYPVVAKPDLGCRGAGVRPVRDRAELLAYLHGFPRGETLILQRLAVGAGEAGVFYVREPGRRQGGILSLTLKYFPEIIGDGRATIETLIRRDPRAGQVARLYLPRFAGRLGEVPASGERVPLVFAGNHSKGAIFRDGRGFVTEALVTRFDAIADSIPGFHFGRFDVRFADFAAFRGGQGFTIVEFNGAGAEATHIWDSRMTLFGAWKTLARQMALLFAIGAANRRLGHRPEGWRMLIARWRRERRATKRYPLTA
ncbi:hypothetical protein [Sphingomonas sp.]|uniref:hypothetical protein n=1 Tax=Sphingomonas sp. TaxID=28214 RepID=UPI001B004B24|nr:hypothetical protein [Sphingomonas sp.]MBO9711688.1 hypothetical protein [Sphingomonas sp.]